VPGVRVTPGAPFNRVPVEHHERASPSGCGRVAAEQEIALFGYRFLERQQRPFRVYSERGIRREGEMDSAMVNPIEIDGPDEIVAALPHTLTQPKYLEHYFCDRL
jgi:hypothetical protein